LGRCPAERPGAGDALRSAPKRGHPVVLDDPLVEVPGEQAEFALLPGRDAGPGTNFGEVLDCWDADKLLTGGDANSVPMGTGLERGIITKEDELPVARLVVAGIAKATFLASLGYWTLHLGLGPSLSRMRRIMREKREFPLQFLAQRAVFAEDSVLVRLTCRTMAMSSLRLCFRGLQRVTGGSWDPT